MATPKASAGTDRDWEAESAADTLIRAAEIRNDKKLYAAAKKKLVEKAKAAQRATLEARARTGLKRAFPAKGK